MERIAGLREYVAWKQYRSALGLPDQVMEEYRMLAQGGVQQELPVYASCYRKKAGAACKLRQPDAFRTSDTVRI